MKKTTVHSGLRIAYADAGIGTPAVVFIHGAFGNRRHYVAQLEHLRGRCRVLAPDLRGHGESEAPSGPFGLREAAEDVLAVCDAAGVGRVVLCGHSWPVALQVAAMRPEIVAGVVLLDGAVLFPEPMRAQTLSNFVPGLEGPGWAEAMRQYFGGRAFSAFDSQALKTRLLDAIGEAPPQFAAQMMRDVMSSDWAPQLTSGNFPLLYIHANVPVDLERLRQLRPDALIGVVAGAGHWMMLEVPDQVNAMLDRFLHIVEAGSPAPTRPAAVEATSR